MPQLQGSGLRFRDASEEVRYREWYLEEARTVALTGFAARMESHGVAGRVQVTESTRACIASRYECEAQGPTEIKGKGPLDVWLVVEPSAQQ